MENSFICENCHKEVINTLENNRNHCPYCLYSKHVDIKSGDRMSLCRGMMEPIGLTFKKIKPDKFNPNKKGELMIIHQCLLCKYISINKLAVDDRSDLVLSIFENSQKNQIELPRWIIPAGKEDVMEIKNQLFGKKISAA